MPRPTSKVDLLIAANEQYEKLWKLIDTLENPQEVVFNFTDPKLKEAHWKRDKNLRDVFIHLHEWHKLLLNWVEKNMQLNCALLNAAPVSFLPAPYNWKTYGDMNVMFWEKHQDTAYDDSVEMLKNSHAEVLKLIEQFTNEELFAKNVFTWIGGSTLGSYCVSVTSSHYEWAMKKIKAYKKSA